MYDLLITHGLILDGTGSAPYQADVAVSQGDIVAIGSLPDTAHHTLDAAGLVVAPGFIDLHTHSDFSFLLDPTAQSKIRQGVTLELAGNCGSSYCAPLQGVAHEMLRVVAHLAIYRDLYAHLERFWGLSGRCAAGGDHAEPGGAGRAWDGAELRPWHGGQSRQRCRVRAHEDPGS